MEKHLNKNGRKPQESEKGSILKPTEIPYIHKGSARRQEFSEQPLSSFNRNSMSKRSQPITGHVNKPSSLHGGT